jgi:predicted amidohydrolase
MSGETFKVACVQNCAGTETEPNLKDCAELVREAAGRGAAFILLPEYFTGLDIQGHILIPEAFAETDHPALPLFAGLAQEHRAWILLGSLAITLEGGAIANRSYLLDPDGAIAARYDKVHLFDVDLAGGESYRESETIAPGACATVADLPWGRVGLSICYDLRFAQLYRALAKAGADFLTVPAAFTKTTGQAHWHVLLRARAIETGCFVFAPCQFGPRRGGRRGRSGGGRAGTRHDPGAPARPGLRPLGARRGGARGGGRLRPFPAGPGRPRSLANDGAAVRPISQTIR